METLNMDLLQDKMFKDLHDNSLFRKAETFGLDYLSNALDRHVYPHQSDLDNLSQFDEILPTETGQAHKLIEMLNQYGSPATTSMIGGRYFGFVNGSVIPAGLAAKNLSIFWDQNSAMEIISPIASKLESVVQNWLIDLFSLPKTTVAGFVSGTSMANFCGLAAARYRILENQSWNITEQGMFGAPKIRVVTSREAHSTILKAISLIGLGKGNIEWVDVDEQGRIKIDQIPELDETTILILQAGNVNSGSFDNFSKICLEAKKKGAWIHIDGAFGLWAGATRRLKHLTKDFEYADSWAVDGHKTLNTPYDSGIVLCNDAEALTASLHMTGAYIVIGEGRDGMYYTPEMSRRARIIELWATIRYLGRNGIDELIWLMHQRAKQFAEGLSKISGFTILNEIVFNQVIVQCDSDKITESVIQEIQNSRECWAGGSIWKGRKVIRISVCSWTTTQEDIKRTINTFQNSLEIVLMS